MSIESVGTLNNLLKTHDSNSWIKDLSSVKIDFNDKQSFSEFLAKSIEQVNTLQEEANLAIEKLATGRSKNIHETLLIVERAEIAFKTMNQIRQKIIEAYREVMKMQV